MDHLKFLNSKEKKDILDSIKNQFNMNRMMIDHIFIKNNHDKLYIINNSLKDFDFSNLRVNSLGMYFGKIEKNGIRLSIEGSQLVGGLAKQNVLELNNVQLKEWVKGNEIQIESDVKGFVIIKNNNDYFGSGLLKNGILLNYFPKTRRMKNVNDE